jgi:hypothetical protein
MLIIEENKTEEQKHVDLVNKRYLNQNFRTMSIEELSTYADYMNKKACTTDDQTFRIFALTALETSSSSDVRINPTGVANVAVVLLEASKRGMNIGEWLWYFEEGEYDEKNINGSSCTLVSLFDVIKEDI